MVKTAISERRKISFSKQKKKIKNDVFLKLNDFEGISKEHIPNDYLSDTKNLGNAIVECLESNDPQGVMEIIEMHLHAINKSELSENKKIHRQTLYSAFKHKNPTIKTLAKIMHDYSK